ncbi:MAG TPA: aspartate--tRNA ligase [Candidatus Paceibacterota bacterium]|nr:aspartate--tRNA ligase [Candidatus Paceibacterota bacterium]
MRTFSADIIKKEGEEIEMTGWVEARRDHGKLVFIDIRDRSGIAQVVFNTADISEAGELRLEYLIKLTGVVKKRPAKMFNDNIPTGQYEVQAKTLEIISKAEAMPIAVDDDGYAIDEEVRLKYRYLDLRRRRMHENIVIRDKAMTLVREYLHKQHFIEIETPLLTKTSPEGARDFLVPSRVQHGKFYALPQSPQQYKQLLMIAGFERYFQIARALRDEDSRGDRQPEHTQIDMEASFVSEQEMRDITEGMMIHLVESLGKKIAKKPFPVFTHEEAMKQFGADKFDLREDKEDKDTLAFAWVIDFPLFEKTDEGGLTFAHNPFSAPKAEYVEELLASDARRDQEKLLNMRAQQYDLVCNGYEMASGGVRISNPKVQRKVFEIMGLTPEQTESRFGHIIKAYEFGAPTHAGIAPGLDRLMMILRNEPNIREVIAFPKTGDGRDPMMNSPSEVDKKQLDELGLSINKK